ncbi:hypothetical protein [Streptomyces sp. LN785]|uniref:hypothetical protein n=1 Tax=Streptomyces sp. LN785 TaxID=3112983 RepID=UPI003710D3D2
MLIRSLWFSPLHALRGMHALRARVKAMTFSEPLGLVAPAVGEWGLPRPRPVD